MLKMKHSYHLDFPHITFSAPQVMQFAPVNGDNDELTQDVMSDPQTHDNNWELVERPDTAELEQYWTNVREDIMHDPEWSNFASSQE